MDIGREGPRRSRRRRGRRQDHSSCSYRADHDPVMTLGTLWLPMKV